LTGISAHADPGIQNPLQALPQDGLYEIHGTHSPFGEYSGQIAIHGSKAERIIHWKNYRYSVKTISGESSKELETIWTGTATQQALDFNLTFSNVLTEYEGYAPSPIELMSSAHVVIQPTQTGPISFSVSGEGTYAETWNRIGDAPQEPLWKDERKIVDATGEKPSWIVKVALWLGVSQAIEWYRSQPQIQPYVTRDEFLSRQQLYTFDSTDSEFYAHHPNTLRIANHTINPLSLAEAAMRRNAFAPKLFEKAEFFRKETLQYSLNSAGVLEFFERGPQGEKVGRTGDYDAALWTAMMGYAELLRYQATQNRDSLQVFRKILDGVLTLVEIPGNKKEFARALATSPQGEDLGEGWHRGTGKNSQLQWRSGGNNDMIKGLYLTLILAHQVVAPEEQELRKRILNASKSILSTKAAHYNDDNEALAHGLIALWSDDSNEKSFALERFSKNYLNLTSVLGSHFTTFYYGGVADWSGIHLSMISSLCQVLLAKELQATFSDSDDQRELSDVLRYGKRDLLRAHEVYRPVHRDALTLFTYIFAADLTDREKLRSEAIEALRSLREMPAPRFVGKGTVDLTLNPGWSYSAWPRVPWKAIKGIRKIESSLDFKLFEQGAYAYPIYETLAWSSNYIWKDSPFATKFSSDPRKEPFSADYLLAYWASRASGLITAQD
jgi:hypothetical protein